MLWIAVMPEPEPSARGSASRVGETLREKYRLVSVLGVGGMATVYEAVHRNGRRFAVKILHTELSAHPEIRTRFVREGYVANRVEHPGVVDIVDDDVAEDGSPFVVMELLDGASVASKVESGRPLPVPEVLEIADQVLDVLEAAHARGVVHRDLKPANLFLTPDGRTKVLDFGIARLRETDVGKTASGIAMGTPAYMAPEQAAGRVEDIDERTDLWALGATMFALISGECVHSGTNPQHQVVNAATQPARSLAVAVPGVHPAIVAVVDHALSFERSARFPTAAAMRSALRAAAEQAFGTPLGGADGFASATRRPLGGPVGGAGAADEETVGRTLAPLGLEPAPRRRVRLGVALGAVLVGLAAGLLWLHWMGRVPGRDAPAADGGVAVREPVRPVGPAPEPVVSEPEPVAVTAPPAPEEAAPIAEPVRVEPAVPQAAAPPRAPAEAPAVRREPPRVVAPRPRACSRLLERQSLGETLTPEERETLRRECRG